MAQPDNVYFLDTNILVYAFEPEQSTKQKIARRLIQESAPWVISWQIVQEFCSVARHRFDIPLDIDYLDTLIDLLLSPHCRVFPTPALWSSALSVQAKTQYRFYDCLVIVAAIESGATILYSEDLQHGRTIDTLTIQNPFL